MLVEVSNKTRSQINLVLVKKITTDFLVKHRLTKQEVSVVFIGDCLMRRLNKEYRHLDKVTDVLSFREQDSPNPSPGFLGEIVIDYQQIKKQARRLKHSTRYELIYILVHGLLHLIGYDDRTESQAKAMDKLTLKFLKNKKI